MIGRIAIANVHRERTAEENLAHDRALLNARVAEKAAERRHAQQLNINDRWLPMYVYLLGANIAWKITTNKYFESFILYCIMLASVLVGIDQYPASPDDDLRTALFVLESIVMHAFIVEAFLKIWAEGDSPWYYFLGNEGKWNTFDFVIVLFANPYIEFSEDADGLEIFRLVRLMRLVKVFRRVPQLRMILMGLIGGLSSIVYIVVLMCLTFYLYGLMGIIFFRDTNDPWHFKNVAVSMLTLLRVATLDGWGVIFYINYLGCDVMASDYYYKTVEDLAGMWPPRDDEEVHSYRGIGRLGQITECKEGEGTGYPILTTVYFLSFIVIASFCMLSLFVGAVSMSMSESMEKMQEEKEEARKKEKRGHLDAEIERLSDNSSIERRVRFQVTLLKQAFTGQILDPEVVAFEEKIEYQDRPYLLKFKQFARLCGRISDDKHFQRFVTTAILMAGVQVGLTTYEYLDEYWILYGWDWMDGLDKAILAVFWLELILKVIAEEFRVQHVFKYAWNVFDLMVLVLTHSISGNMVMILRLLRLMRVLKLMRALPQLQVIISALMNGISSIGFISVLLALFFFFFGVIGKEFFGANDPWHFGSLHMSVLTLFQLATLDDWTIVMYISLYGCDVYGGGYYEDGLYCEPNHNLFWVTFVYFTIFILVGALVLFTLFIGVVSMSFEEAQDEQHEEEKTNKRVHKFATAHHISSDQLYLYREVFDLVDFTKSRLIGKQELKFGLKLAEMDITENQFAMLWARLDKDQSDGVDMAEFLDFMVALRSEIAGEESLKERRGRMFHKTGASHKPAQAKPDDKHINEIMVVDTKPTTVHKNRHVTVVPTMDDDEDFTMVRSPHASPPSKHLHGAQRAPLYEAGAYSSSVPGRSSILVQQGGGRRPLPKLASHITEGTNEGVSDDESLMDLEKHLADSNDSTSAAAERNVAKRIMKTVERQIDQLSTAAKEQMDRYHDYQSKALEIEMAKLDTGGGPKSALTKKVARRVAEQAQEVAETAAALAMKASAILEQANHLNVVASDGQSLARGRFGAMDPEARAELMDMQKTVDEMVNVTGRAAGILPPGVSTDADHWGDYAKANGRTAGVPSLNQSQDESDIVEYESMVEIGGRTQGFSVQRTEGVIAQSANVTALKEEENGFLVPDPDADASALDESLQSENAQRAREGDPVLVMPVKKRDVASPSPKPEAPSDVSSTSEHIEKLESDEDS